MTEKTVITVALVTLVLGLYGMALITANVQVGMAAFGAMTGLFAWLQVPPPPPPPGTTTLTNLAQITETAPK